MPPPRVVRVGERYGQLVITEDRFPGTKMVSVRCDCGRTLRVRFGNLGRSSTSCGGCWRFGTRNPRYRHGGASTNLYDVWCQIIQRCTKPSHPRWADYGGRGIRICEEWRHDFGAFRDHLGAPPDEAQRWTVDRIDNDGNYEPGNVRWATYTEQVRNRRVA